MRLLINPRVVSVTVKSVFKERAGITGAHARSVSQVMRLPKRRDENKFGGRTTQAAAGGKSQRSPGDPRLSSLQYYPRALRADHAKRIDRTLPASQPAGTLSADPDGCR